mgnify:CR=1 FL=1
MIINERTIAENIKRYWMVGIVTFGLAALFGCQQEVNVPSEIIGTWNTSSAKYKDRYIQFTENALIFGLGNDQASVNVIKKIKNEKDQLMRFFTFYYRDLEGEKWTLSILYFPYQDNGVFQLQNRNELWKRCL